MTTSLLNLGLPPDWRNHRWLRCDRRNLGWGFGDGRCLSLIGRQLVGNHSPIQIWIYAHADQKIANRGKGPVAGTTK